MHRVFLNKSLRTLFLAVLISGLPAISQASWFDGMTVSAGKDFGSDTDLTSYRSSLTRTWESRWFNEGDWYIGGYFDFSANYWKNNLSKRSGVSQKGTSSISALAFSPVVRVTRKTPWFGNFVPFAEAGVGLALLSDNELRAKGDKPVDLGIKAQFEDRIGFGFMFGERQQFQIMVRAFHYSNASLHRDNDGVNLQEIAFGWTFP